MLVCEFFAVAFGILYLLLAMREQPWCWMAGFVSTTLFAFLCFQSHLYMDALLQLYYMLMAIVGWFRWRVGGKGHGHLSISTWFSYQHVLTIFGMVTLSLFSEWLLIRYTDASYPLIDSLLAWGGVITTYMMTQKILENWLYWIVLDAIAIGLYFTKGLYLTTALFVVYTLLAVRGYWIWRQRFQQQPGVQMVTRYVT